MLSRRISRLFYQNISIIPEYPDEFLFDYTEKAFTTSVPSQPEEIKYVLYKDIDPATLKNLVHLLNGRTIESFSVQIGNSSVPYNESYLYSDVAVKSVELIYSYRSNFLEKVTYQAGTEEEIE